MFLRSAETAALRRGLNRDSLVAGLQEGATDVCFVLKGCNDAEFTVLCKTMTVQGPAVRRVVSEQASLDFSHADLRIDAFVVALASCSHLVELRWVLCVPSSCPAATAILQVHASRVGECGGWVGGCRLEARLGVWMGGTGTVVQVCRHDCVGVCGSVL